MLVSTGDKMVASGSLVSCKFNVQYTFFNYHYSRPAIVSSGNHSSTMDILHQVLLRLRLRVERLPGTWELYLPYISNVQYRTFLGSINSGLLRYVYELRGIFT